MANVKINGLVKVKAAKEMDVPFIHRLMLGLEPDEKVFTHYIAEGTVARVMYVHEEDGAVSVAPPKGSLTEEGVNEKSQLLQPGDFEVIEEGDGDFTAAAVAMLSELHPQDGEALGLRVGDRFAMTSLPEAAEDADDYPFVVGGEYEVIGLDPRGPAVITEEGIITVLHPKLAAHIQQL